MSLLRVIIVEDSEDDMLLLLRALKKGGYELIHIRVETRAGLEEALKDERWQIIISDHAMPRFSAPEALEVLKESGRDIPFIIVSGTIGEDVAVKAMKTGAHDYIMKVNLSRLAPAIERELRDAQVREQHRFYEEQLKFLSLYDQLTGLYNRVFFENELERLEGSSAHPVIILSADLDGLRLINDTMGQKEGDRVLKACSELLSKPLQKDDVLARVGGDEFVALVPRASSRNGDKIIDSIRRGIEEYNSLNSHLPLHISLGYAVSKGENEPLEKVLKEAINNMWLDKENRAQSARNQVVKALLAALSERDYIASGHADRLQELCLKMGEMVGLDQHRLTALSLVAQVHDLGKVGIPDRILFKKESLSEKEWEVMRQHPEKGYRIAKASPDLAPVADLILRHHERWDGAGYPLGLAGKDIPVECRILSIVDSFDAMINDRPYRKARSKEEALEELRRCAGTQFDPEMVELFISIV